MQVSPLCDRDRDSSVAGNQKGFIDFVVRPVYEPLMSFLSDEIPLTNLKINYQTWNKQLQEKVVFEVKDGRASNSISSVPTLLKTEANLLKTSVIQDASVADNKTSGGAGGSYVKRESEIRRFSIVSPLIVNDLPEKKQISIAATALDSQARKLDKKLSSASFFLNTHKQGTFFICVFICIQL